MTRKLSASLRGYFETLYKLNQNLIKCCGLDVIENSGQYEQPIQEIIQDIPRLIPYCRKKNSDDLVIDPHDGLLEFSDELPFLQQDYEQILQNNYLFLSDIKQIRNKLEHRMHGVMLESSGNSTLFLFDMDYAVGEKKITLEAEDFILVTKEMNTLFSRIQKQLMTYVRDNELGNYPYYRRLLRYNFSDFNKIYESDVLRIVGQALFPF